MPFVDDEIESLTAVDFATSEDGLMIGETSVGRTTAYVTGDGGQRWVPIAFPEEITGISDVRVVR